MGTLFNHPLKYLFASLPQKSIKPSAMEGLILCIYPRWTLYLISSDESPYDRKRKSCERA